MTESITLDLSDLQTEKQFHRRIREAFSFPSYYGENKDAFWDCIGDFTDNVTVVIKGEEALPAEMKVFVGEYLAILDEYEGEAAGTFKVQRNQILGI